VHGTCSRGQRLPLNSMADNYRLVRIIKVEKPWDENLKRLYDEREFRDIKHVFVNQTRAGRIRSFQEYRFPNQPLDEMWIVIYISHRIYTEQEMGLPIDKLREFAQVEFSIEDALDMMHERGQLE